MTGRPPDAGRAVPARLTARVIPSPGLLLLIAAGGAAGTAVRASLQALWPSSAGTWPWATFGINVAGSFLLAALLEVLSAGPDKGWRRGVRLGAGTGLLGGFTTYSTFSVEVVLGLRAGTTLLTAGYAAASVALGVGAAILAGRGTRLALRRQRDAVSGRR